MKEGDLRTPWDIRAQCLMGIHGQRSGVGGGRCEESRSPPRETPESAHEYGRLRGRSPCREGSRSSPRAPMPQSSVPPPWGPEAPRTLVRRLHADGNVRQKRETLQDNEVPRGTRGRRRPCGWEVTVTAAAAAWRRGTESTGRCRRPRGRALSPRAARPAPGRPRAACRSPAKTRRTGATPAVTWLPPSLPPQETPGAKVRLRTAHTERNGISRDPFCDPRSHPRDCPRPLCGVSRSAGQGLSPRGGRTWKTRRPLVTLPGQACKAR